MGLVLGLAVIPTPVFGPARTLAYYQEWTQVLLWPGLGAGSDRSRAKELIEVTATDSQSFQAMIHNMLHPDPATRPPQPSAMVRATHWLAGGLMTLVTLFLARRREDGSSVLITFGALIVIMLLLSPVCHLHYFCLSLPLGMGLLAAVWERDGNPLERMAVYTVLILHGIATALPHIPGLQPLRDSGMAGWGALLLWLVGMVILWQRSRSPTALQPHQPHMSGAAA
jgi:hypothetical protein